MKTHANTAWIRSHARTAVAPATAVAGSANTTRRVVRAWLAWTFVFSFTYAIVRYNVFHGVPMNHIPLYVTNKAIALTAVALLGSAQAWRTRSDRAVRRGLGLWGFGLAALHVAVSMTILGPHYFAKFYESDGRMTLGGELSILCGVLCFFALAIPAVSSLPGISRALGEIPWQRVQASGRIGLGLAAAHVLFMGAPGWFKPATWPGGLPPITLLAFVAVVMALTLRTLHRLRRPRTPNNGVVDPHG